MAGTSGGTEPATWNTANNSTTVSGGATFTNVTGQSTYGWSASAGTLNTISGTRPAAGDRVFLSSDHTESSTASLTYPFNTSTAAFGLIQLISVNRAGSVPPTASDILSGASITTTVTTGNLVLDAYCNLFWQGIAFTLGGTGVNNLYLNNASTARKSHYLKNCALVLTNTNASTRITTNNVAKVTLDNTTIQFGNVAQAISSTQPFDFNWINTPSAIAGATIPTVLFSGAVQSLLVACRGIDLSAITTTLLNSATASEISKILLDSCKIASGVIRYSVTSTTGAPAHDEIELVNCFDGTNIVNERHTAAGDVTTDFSTTLTGGAQDDVGHYSHKLVSSARSDICTMALDSFWLDVENTAVGSSKTATVEIVSPTPGFNNTDIKLQLEYMGTSGSSLASFGESLASVLTAAAALGSSSATWTTPAFTTFNPFDLNGAALSNGNLTVTGTSNGSGFGSRAITGFSTGKYYWEITVGVWASSSSVVGLAAATAAYSGGVGTTVMNKGGTISINGSGSGSTLGARAVGDTIGIAIDFGAGLIWYRVAPSGNWNGSGTANPATGTGGISLGALIGSILFPSFGPFVVGDAATANFGATAFSGAVPSGFTAGWSFSTTKQQLQVTFTPQTAGRVRGLVRLGKVNTTVWVNPQIAIS